MPIELHRDGPWELPKGWVWARLFESATILPGQSPPSDTYNTSGIGLPFFQGKSEFGEYFPTVQKYCSCPVRIAEPGDVLISVRAPVGPTNVADVRCAIGRGLAAIRPRNGVESRWLLFALRRIERSIAEQATGTTFGGIPTSLLNDVLIPIAPTNEQRRISVRIDDLFTEIADGEAALARARNDLDTWRRALLKAAVSGDLTRDWRKKNKPHETGQELLKRIRNVRAQRFGEVRPARRRASRQMEDIDQATIEIPETWSWATWSEVGISQNGRHFRAETMPQKASSF
jgi:type I restriction enzyme S subunit